MSRKSAKIEALISAFEGRELDAHYLAYFECFNQQLYFEAHDVLEEIWLQDRNSARGIFYKALIQLAGAFVHLQKQRLGPAAALFRLSRENLRGCPEVMERLRLDDVLNLIKHWLDGIEAGGLKVNPFSPATAPVLRLTL